MYETTTLLLDYLRAPITEERPWVVFAACRDADPDLFFPSSREQEAAAKSLCAMCPVVRECNSYSFDARESFGIWGGVTEKQRRVELRQTA